MKRNQHNQIKRASRLHAEGSQVYRSTIYPNIDRHISDIYIEALGGDRLDSLAWQYYGDTTMWWIIAKANNVGKGGLTLESGLQIRIPKRLDKIISDYKKIQKER